MVHSISIFVSLNVFKKYMLIMLCLLAQLSVLLLVELLQHNFHAVFHCSQA